MGIKRFEQKGFKLVAIKMLNASTQLLEKHYEDLSARPFFPGLVKYMASGLCVSLVSMQPCRLQSPCQPFGNEQNFLCNLQQPQNCHQQWTSSALQIPH